MSKNYKFSLVFSPQQWGYLTAESDRLSISVAELIRRLIAEARGGFNEPERKVKARMSSRIEG